MGVVGFSRIKNWIALDNFTANAINAEFNNLFTNLAASSISGAAGSPATLAGMQAQTDPGDQGSEVLPVTIQDDIREIRYQLNQIIGEDYWYDQPPTSLAVLDSVISGLTGLQRSRIIDGQQGANGQPLFLTADGTDAEVNVAQFLRVEINGEEYQFDTTLSVSGLTLAPSTGNTCVVVDGNLTGQQSSKSKSTLQIGTVGSNISSLNGQYAAFLNGTEVLIGQVLLDGDTVAATFTNANPTTVSMSYDFNPGDQVIFSGGSLPTGVTAGTIYFVTPVPGSGTFYISTTLTGSYVGTSSGGSGTASVLKSNRIANCYRGWFFDHTNAALTANTITSGATLTLLKVAWIFASNKDGVDGLVVTYNRPTAQGSDPSSASIGDFYFNTSSQEWFSYSGTSWVAADAVLIGCSVQNTTGSIAARSFDFSLSFSQTNTIKTERLGGSSSNIIQSKSLNPVISVYGDVKSFPYATLTWVTSGLSASSTYYCYISPSGDTSYSLIAPTNRTQDLFGFYYPTDTLRCVCSFQTDSGSAILEASVDYQTYFAGPLVSTGLKSKLFTASGTFTVPAGISGAIKVTAIGGGGGSGGAASTAGGYSASGAGGGGGMAIKWVTGLVPGDQVTVTVGTGGGGGAAGNNDGTNGSNSSFGAYCVAGGGPTGNGTPAQTSGTTVIRGGSGGVGLVGDILASGDAGQNAFVFFATGGGRLIIPAYGGGSPMSGSSRAPSGTGAAVAGLFPGGGASGNNNSTGTGSSDLAGAAGAQGMVLVEYVQKV